MEQAAVLAVAEELCLVRPRVRDAEELLEVLAARALEAGYVEATFPRALVDRERHYPTGLPLPTPAAIPHADAQHVRRPALAVALLDPPVEFGEMGSTDRTVSCHLAVMLLVGSPEEQVEVLGRVIGALQRPDWPALLSGAVDPTDLADRFGRLVD